MMQAIIKFLGGIITILVLVWVIQMLVPVAANALASLLKAIPDPSFSLPAYLTPTDAPAQPTDPSPVAPIVPQPEPSIIYDRPTPSPLTTPTPSPTPIPSDSPSPDPSPSIDPTPEPTPTTNDQWICPIVGVGGC